jgi:hypothetical protein
MADPIATSGFAAPSPAQPLAREEYARLAREATTLLTALRAQAEKLGAHPGAVTSAFDSARDGLHRLLDLAGAYRAGGR